MSHRIVFLDVDGVLVTTRSVIAHGKYPGFDPIAGRIIDALCARGPARIVICSAWREQRTREAFSEILQQADISPDYLHLDWTTPFLGGARGDEVKHWIKAHPEVVEYAILDDGIGFEDRDSAYHLVQPHPDFGIGVLEIIELCAVLNIDVRSWFSQVGLKMEEEELRKYRERRSLVEQGQTNGQGGGTVCYYSMLNYNWREPPQSGNSA